MGAAEKLGPCESWLRLCMVAAALKQKKGLNAANAVQQREHERAARRQSAKDGSTAPENQR